MKKVFGLLFLSLCAALIMGLSDKSSEYVAYDKPIGPLSPGVTAETLISA